jgi:hypothetical protein
VTWRRRAFAHRGSRELRHVPVSTLRRKSCTECGGLFRAAGGRRKMVRSCATSYFEPAQRARYSLIRLSSPTSRSGSRRRSTRRTRPPRPWGSAGGLELLDFGGRMGYLAATADGPAVPLSLPELPESLLKGTGTVHTAAISSRVRRTNGRAREYSAAAARSLRMTSSRSSRRHLTTGLLRLDCFHSPLPLKRS